MDAVISKQRVRAPRAIPDVEGLPRTAVLTTAQMRGLTGFSTPTLKLWRSKGRGPQVTMIEGRPRYLAGDVRDWLAKSSKLRVA